MISKLDDLLTHIGTGKWSYMHILPLCYSFWIVVMQAMNGAFMAPKLNFSCRPPAHAVDRATPISALNESVILSNVTQDCAYSAEDPVTGEVEEQKCTEWDFDNSTFISTVTSEFDLVCGREYLRAMYTSMYMFGIFFGAPMNGFLADKYGRRPLVLVGGIAYVVIAILSTWLPNLSAILVARFLLGVVHPLVVNSGYILAIEVSEPRLRTALGITLYLPWALGAMALGGLAYLLRNWRTLQLAMSVIGVAMFPAFWFMDESPRWLMVTGEHERALKVLKKAAKWNKVSLPPQNELLTLMKEVETLRPFGDDCDRVIVKVRIKFSLRTPKLRLITSVMYLDYLVLAMVYYGLSLSGGNLSSDPFVYMVLSGLMEVPAYTLAFPVVHRFGRRGPTVLCCLLCGLALFVLAAVPTDYSWLIVTMALFGKMTITVAFQIAILYSSELFPTEVRSRGIGTCFMLSRIGSICSPFITDFLGSLISWAPSVVFGAASLVIGLATVALPETLGMALPDTIADLEERDCVDSRRSFLPSFLKKSRPERN
ncbi:organic cation transporter protein-like [Penaeus monodon]|uniref:organic cation transporter protein-like n=1 Tax=Penaeus monodon TaxID=6687 RepID=UPI0018A7B6AE|nr:organic cation transporter protein-like [Penaeus monodon]